MGSTPDDALRAWFIGPRAESAERFERLVTEALRDHVFWRRNYHPEDGFTIRETDRRTPGNEQAVATLIGCGPDRSWGHLTSGGDGSERRDALSGPERDLSPRRSRRNRPGPGRRRVPGRDRAMTRRGPRIRPVAVLVAVLALLLAGPLRGQDAPKPAAEVADEYLRGIEAMAWRATAQRIHPAALAELREVIEIHLAPDVDREGTFLESLGAGQDLESFLSLDDGSLFVSVMRALARETPGIVNAMTARTTEVIGVVAESDGVAHAVYRLHWELSGAEPEVKVLSLSRDGRGRWRVREAPELASVRPAIRALRRRMRPPSP